MPSWVPLGVYPVVRVTKLNGVSTRTVPVALGAEGYATVVVKGREIVPDGM